jgi:serine/threonine protein phosphatase PrpC
MLVFEAAARSDIGRVRETNQDAHLVRNDLGTVVVAHHVGGPDRSTAILVRGSQ